MKQKNETTTRARRASTVTMAKIVIEMPGLVEVAKRTIAQMRADCSHATGSSDVTPLLYLVGKMAASQPTQELDAQGDLVTPPWPKGDA